MSFNSASNNHASSKYFLRVILFFFILGILGVQFFALFRGLYAPEAMDQAQIARNIARGEGFTTQFLRPMQLMEAQKAALQNAAKMETPEEKEQAMLKLDSFADANYAPLHSYVLAAALKLSGNEDFNAVRMEEKGAMIYAPDYAIAAVSMVFFLIALFLSYIVMMRLFDEAIAVGTVLFMGLSDLFLQYSVSGLPMPMMLSFLLAAVYMLIMATQAQEDDKATWQIGLWVFLAFVFVGLMCLTGWMGLWLALGLLVFVGTYLRPFGILSMIGVGVLVAMLSVPYMNIVSTTGSAWGNAFYAFYNHFGQGSDMVQRSTLASSVPLDSKNFVLKAFGYVFKQAEGLYVNLGSILVTPFFFLSLFNSYKRPTTEGIKWAVAWMSLFALIGMCFFGSKEVLAQSQIFILLAPFFVAYGLSIVYNVLARSIKGVNGTHFALVRNFSLAMMLIVSAGPFIYSFSKMLGTGRRSFPHWPPYYPVALNTKLVANSNAQDIIVSDQPWAVAWYADRTSLWTPLKVQSFTQDLLPLIQKLGSDVQAFLVTPSSFRQGGGTTDSAGGVVEVVRQAGDFAPMVLEGTLLKLSPTKNFFFANLFDGADLKDVGSLISSKGVYGKRVSILGVDMLLYSKKLGLND